MNSNFRKLFITKLLTSFYVRIFPFSLYCSMCSLISQCRFQEKSVSRLHIESNGVTLWDEFTHQKTISQNNCFWFLSEDICFVTRGFNALQNIPLQTPWKQCYQTAQWKWWCKPARWIHTSQNSFSERCFPVFMRIFPISP